MNMQTSSSRYSIEECRTDKGASACFTLRCFGFRFEDVLTPEQARKMAFALLAVVGEGEEDEPVAPSVRLDRAMRTTWMVDDEPSSRRPSLPEDHPANTAMRAGCEAALRFEAAEKDYYQQNWPPPHSDEVCEQVTWDPASEVDCVDWRDQEKRQLRAIGENDTELSELQEFDRRRAAHSLHRIEGLDDAS